MAMHFQYNRSIFFINVQNFSVDVFDASIHFELSPVKTNLLAHFSKKNVD